MKTMMKMMMKTMMKTMTCALAGLVSTQGQPTNQKREAALLVESQHSSPSLITTSARLLCGGSVATATPLPSKMFGPSPKALMSE